MNQECLKVVRKQIGKRSNHQSKEQRVNKGSKKKLWLRFSRV